MDPAIIKTPSARPAQPLAEDVTRALTLAIHEHRIKPGMKLGEDELADIYGVSRTVVRSALHALAHLQLVDIQRNRGAFVAQPTLRDAREVFEAPEWPPPRPRQKTLPCCSSISMTNTRHWPRPIMAAPCICRDSFTSKSPASLTSKPSRPLSKA